MKKGMEKKKIYISVWKKGENKKKEKQHRGEIRIELIDLDEIVESANTFNERKFEDPDLALSDLIEIPFLPARILLNLQR
ncbi:hypothetical protein TNCT_573991 [Trichonephila clavata]|uniref:Uncharacterized protein n=1 Tax=Trichonephila clavata TaxID=2740835 RepID=A0A8X6IF62_TRICU|nr:hypothetical protein TNCT_573991 [Trichonephila clavata]